MRPTKQRYKQVSETDTIPNPTQREPERLAMNAGIDPGLLLKAKEYRRKFQVFVGAGKHHRVDGSLKSYREIAAEIGGARGYTTVRNWMKQDFPGVFRAMGGHYEPFGLTQDDRPTVSLTAVVFDALKGARAALPAVRNPYERGKLVELLEQMLNEAKRIPRERSPF